MKTMTILIGMTLWAAGNDAIAADNSDSLILENQVLRMEICRTPVPYVQRLVHKDSGRVVVSGLGSRNLFSIASANEDGKQETIESAAAGRSDVSMTKAGTVSKIVIKYAQVPGVRRCRRGDGGVRRTGSVDAVDDKCKAQSESAYRRRFGSRSCWPYRPSMTARTTVWCCRRWPAR